MNEYPNIRSPAPTAPTAPTHFRQVAIWPIQLLPIQPDEEIQRHWEVFEALAPPFGWQPVVEEAGTRDAGFSSARYKEFVTFVPQIQRLLYGSLAGQELADADREPGIRVYRTDRARQARLSFADGGHPVVVDVERFEVQFFVGLDVAFAVVEIAADGLSAAHATAIEEQFGCAYPSEWDAGGEALGCPRLVEWLDANGELIAASDYAERERYIESVARYRAPRIAHHWAELLRPLVHAHPAESGGLRFRPLESHLMPRMVYRCTDVAEPGESAGPPRIELSDIALTMSDRPRAEDCGDPDVGALAEFRRQYFIIFLLAHLSRAALTSLADEVAMAMEQLDPADSESVKRFKRRIGHLSEGFLRFTHRYWFGEVSVQPGARAVFRELKDRLALDTLHSEVREEIVHLSDFLDSDTARRQSTTLLRLTIVTVFGLVATMATGLLGMNIFAYAHESVAMRAAIFIASLLLTFVVTIVLVSRSKRLTEFLDTLSDEDVRWRDKLRSLGRALS